jgi:hypothetical protein
MKKFNPSVEKPKWLESTNPEVNAKKAAGPAVEGLCK